MNGSTPQLDIEHMRLVSFSVTFAAADVLIAEELHLNLFITKPGAPFTTTGAGVEGEGSRSQSGGLRFREAREKLPDTIECSHVNGRCRSWRSCQRRLVDEDHLVDIMCAKNPIANPGRLLAGDTLHPDQILIEHILDERAFPGSGNAGDATEGMEGKSDVDILEVVLSSPENFEIAPRLPTLRRRENPFFASKVSRGEGVW